MHYEVIASIRSENIFTQRVDQLGQSIRVKY